LTKEEKSMAAVDGGWMAAAVRMQRNGGVLRAARERAAERKPSGVEDGVLREWSKQRDEAREDGRSERRRQAEETRKEKRGNEGEGRGPGERRVEWEGKWRW
jgi:hypothetical protein